MAWPTKITCSIGGNWFYIPDQKLMKVVIWSKNCLPEQVFSSLEKKQEVLLLLDYNVYQHVNSALSGVDVVLLVWHSITTSNITAFYLTQKCAIWSGFDGQSSSLFYLVLVGVAKRLDSPEGLLICLVPELGRVKQLAAGTAGPLDVCLTLFSFFMSSLQHGDFLHVSTELPKHMLKE